MKCNKKVVIILGIICLIVICGVVTIKQMKAKKVLNEEKNEISNIKVPPPPEEKKIDPISNNKIENNCEIFSKKIECKENNENAIYILNNANVKINDVEISKSGIVDHFSYSDFYGINAALFLKEGILNISNSKINSNGNGTNAIFAKGYNSKVSINNLQIETYGNRARGIDALDKATIEGENISIITNGNKSSGITTDRGSGNINLKNVNVETNGVDSVGIYSTGNIKITNSKINSKNSEACVIEGENKLDLIDVEMIANKKRGIMIMSSMPNEMKMSGTLNILNGTLNVSEGPAFYVTNNKAKINLENVKINNNSNIFINASKNTDGEMNQESTFKDLKGGIVEMIGKKQVINGNIIVDDVSSVDITLLDDSYYKGALNQNNTKGKININCDNTSVIELTGDSYINELNFENKLTIITNGYNIFYNKLNGKQENIVINGEGTIKKMNM